MFKTQIVIFLLLLFFTPPFCVFRDPVSIIHQNVSYDGMVKISSRNNSVILGSESSSALKDERPLSQVTFTYDFYIDSVEVSVESYRELMGNLPEEYDSLGEINYRWPVFYVSWYDAVLYCNERSKRDSLDTVYSYVSIEKTVSGEIFRFSGLRVQYDRNGYRLPTEAEWMYAAGGDHGKEYVWGSSSSSDSASLYSWYVGNAGNMPHEPALLLPNNHRLYDMAGNVSEWVNESTISLSGLNVSDYVGGTDYSATAKIVKGGSYSHDIEFLRLSCRSDVYPVEASSRNRYTGFRCATGIITKPVYISENNQVISLEPVTLSIRSLVPFLGTNDARLVFVNRSNISTRTLCFVDYSNEHPVVYQYPTPVDVHNPTISPDGRWVAWATKGEGLAGNSSVIVRRLIPDASENIVLPDSQAFVPRWFIDPSSKDTFLLYVSSAQLNDQVSWRSTQTKIILFKQGMFAGVPVIVEQNGAYHGGMSADGSYLATGYPLLRMKNMTTDEDKVLFFSPHNGKPAGDTSQVCNVSISPDSSRPDQVLFLDFGSGRNTSTITNSVYGTHEILFLGDFSGKVLSWVRAPTPFKAWNYTEWTTTQPYVTASATIENGANRAIILLNIQNGTTAVLCEGEDLVDPYMWIDPMAETIGSDLSLDSVGQYDTPHLSNPQGLLAYKMRLFWHHAESLDVVFIGSSVAADGIDPRHFNGLRGLNMAVGAGDLATGVELIKNYALRQCPNLKIIGISLDMNFFFMKWGAADLYPSFTQSKGYQYDKKNFFWSSGIPDQFTALINSVAIPTTGPDVSFIDSLGLIQFDCMGWGDSIPPVLQTTIFSTESSVYRENIQLISSAFQACSLQNVKVLVMTFPIHPGYEKTDFYSTLGPQHEAARTLISAMDSIADGSQHVTFYDAHLFGRHDYTEDDFFDYLHLCVRGAEKLSVRVDSVFHDMLEE